MLIVNQCRPIPGGKSAAPADEGGQPGELDTGDGGVHIGAFQVDPRFPCGAIVIFAQILQAACQTGIAAGDRGST